LTKRKSKWMLFYLNAQPKFILLHI